MAGQPKTKNRTPKYNQRRREVLQAAARIFNRRGYHLATLDDVAEELGVTKPALYYYARSKEELLFACGQMALEDLSKALDESRGKELTGLERLAQFFRLYAEIVCGDFGRCLVLTEPRDLSPKSRRENVSGRRTINHAIQKIIRDGIEDGSIRACDDRSLSIAMFDAFNGIARWHNPRGALSLPDVVEQYLAIFEKGIATGETRAPGRKPSS